MKILFSMAGNKLYNETCLTDVQILILNFNLKFLFFGFSRNLSQPRLPFTPHPHFAKLITSFSTVAAADFLTLYHICRRFGETAENPGLKFLSIPRDTVRCRYQGGPLKNDLALTGLYKSMLVKRSPIQVLTPRRATGLWWAQEPSTDCAGTSVSPF